jgi:tetratricopeptide (TPR) repeat protein
MKHAKPQREGSFLRPVIMVLVVATIAAAGVRIAFERARPAPLPPAVARAREQMTLAPVLEALDAVRARPHDTAARLALAGACARTGDPVGAALALYPMVTEPPSLPPPAGTGAEALLARYAGYCARAGWLPEADAALARLSPPAVRPALETASAWAARGEAPRAAALLEALERGGERLEASDWLDGAMTWYQCRRPRDAIRWAERGVAAGGSTGSGASSPAARAVLARCLLAAGRPEAALAACSPGSDALLEYWRARAGVRSGDARRREESRRALAHRAEHDPPDGAAAFEAGRAALEAGEVEEAAALLARAAGTGYQEVLAEELLAQAFARAGRPVEANLARGRAARMRGRFAAAEAALRESLRHDPSALGAAVELGQVLLLAGQPAEALAALRAGRKRHPRSLELALGEAEALFRLERFAEQATVLEAAAGLDPERAHEPLRALGRLYYATRQYDRAIPVMERALQATAGDREAHRTLGLCHALRPENPAHAEAALTHLLRALEIEPDDYEPWTKAGGVLQRRGFATEAAACFRRAIAWDSWAEAPYVPLARLLQAEGREPEAAFLLRLYRANRDFERERVPLENRLAGGQGDALTQYRMGDRLFRHVSFGQAYPFLLIAASRKPDWKAAQLRLADVCALLGFDDLRAEAERAAR